MTEYTPADFQRALDSFMSQWDSKRGDLNQMSVEDCEIIRSALTLAASPPVPNMFWSEEGYPDNALEPGPDGWKEHVWEGNSRVVHRFTCAKELPDKFGVWIPSDDEDSEWRDECFLFDTEAEALAAITAAEGK